MRYMRYVGLKNTLLPHLRQRQRSSIHWAEIRSEQLLSRLTDFSLCDCAPQVTCVLYYCTIVLFV